MVADCLQSLPTSLETAGRNTAQPFVTRSLASGIPSLSAAPGSAATPAAMVPHGPPAMNANAFVDPFVAIATTAVPAQITSRGDHPAPRLGIVRLLHVS